MKKKKKKKKLLERGSLREKSLLLSIVFDLSASEEGVVFDALLPEVFALVSIVEYEFNRLFVILLKCLISTNLFKKKQKKLVHMHRGEV